MKEEKFINRDISWLEFNSRVLEEAEDPGNPLMERLKFLAIFSSNLDEFFMVRIAALLSRYHQTGNPAVNRLLSGLRKRIHVLVKEQYMYYRNVILPELAEASIRILPYHRLTTAQKREAAAIFEREFLPVLTPIAIDSAQTFPLIPNLSLELLVRLRHPAASGGMQEGFAVLEVPAVLPRFVALKKDDSGAIFLLAEDLIAKNISALFRGCEILECSPFRITRDMDFSIDDESVDDILPEMQIALQKKMKRIIIRLETAAGMSAAARSFLQKNLPVLPEQTYSIHGPLNLTSLSRLTASFRSMIRLYDPPLPPLPPFRINPALSIVENIRQQGAFMVHHPYESFDPVIRFLEESAEDPAVLAIKQTLYRVSGHSGIVNALIKAAKNGKQVTVLFEIKARFDEENNIRRARELAEAGAHVVYGIAGLKVHCKALLTVRREEDGQLRRYVHLSTGNYNETTAQQYTDLGYFSNDPLLTEDVACLFNVITGFFEPHLWNKLIVAPFNLREKILQMIDREDTRITIKANAVIDSEVMEHLCLAAERGVKIDLAIRGICGLYPVSENIRIVSVLDRFLEHSRIYIFANGGNPEYYLGSADLMPRNLKRRIEILFPVEHPELRQELDQIMAFIFSDKRKGRRVTGKNQYTSTGNGSALQYEETRSQPALYRYYLNRQQNKKFSRLQVKRELHS